MNDEDIFGNTGQCMINIYKDNMCSYANEHMKYKFIQMYFQHLICNSWLYDYIICNTYNYT